LYWKLGKKSDATEAYLELLKQNPDNLSYYEGLLRTEELDITTDLNEESRAKVLQRLDELRETYPKSPAPRRLSLVVAQGTFLALPLSAS
jgi:peptide alpha-N-acetyltransferase